MNECLDIVEKLLKDSALYMNLIKINTHETRACIELGDTGEIATLVLGDKVEVLEGSVKPDFKISMKKQVLKKILEGKADAFALAGRGGADEVRPIEFEIHNKERSEELWETIRALLTYFFIPGKVKVKNLSSEQAGLAHGAHPIPLVYWNGIRYSWILVKHGEVLNKDKERDPWPQTFIILEGKGKAVVGKEEFDIKPNTAIYIPRNTVHQIIAEEDVKLVWLAWQAW